MKCDLWGSVPNGLLDFRGPVPTGIQDFQGPVPTGFPGACPHKISRGLSPQDFQGPVPAVDYESSRGRDNHVMIM